MNRAQDLDTIGGPRELFQPVENPYEAEEINQEAQFNATQRASLRETTPETEQECPVCMRTFSEGRMTECEHFFCEECISYWLETAHSCPICRSSLQAPRWNPTMMMADEQRRDTLGLRILLAELADLRSEVERPLERSHERGTISPLTERPFSELWDEELSAVEELRQRVRRTLTGSDGLSAPSEAPRQEDEQQQQQDLPDRILQPEESREWYRDFSDSA